MEDPACKRQSLAVSAITSIRQPRQCTVCPVVKPPVAHRPHSSAAGGEVTGANQKPVRAATCNRQRKQQRQRSTSQVPPLASSGPHSTLAGWPRRQSTVVLASQQGCGGLVTAAAAARGQ